MSGVEPVPSFLGPSHGSDDEVDVSEDEEESAGDVSDLN